MNDDNDGTADWNLYNRHESAVVEAYRQGLTWGEAVGQVKGYGKGYDDGHTDGKDEATRVSEKVLVGQKRTGVSAWNDATRELAATTLRAISDEDIDTALASVVKGEYDDEQWRYLIEDSQMLLGRIADEVREGGVW